MKKAKRIIASIITGGLLLNSPVTSSVYAPLLSEAHSGRTDSSGGHHDYNNVSGLGYYHYHCGGYPAHLHPNGICPYSNPTPPSPTPSSPSAPKKVNLKIKKKSLILRSGETSTIKLNISSSKATWKSSNTKVATISKSGKLTARKGGKTTISASYGGKTVKCSVTVLQTPPFDIRIHNWDDSSNEISFFIRNTTSHTITVFPTLLAFDDDYDYLTSMNLPRRQNITIAPGKSAVATFKNDDFEDMITCIAQRYRLKIKVDGKIRKCFAEYTHLENRTFTYTLDKALKIK